MTFPDIHLHCRGCNFEVIIPRRSITLRYQIPGAQSVEGHSALAWCNNCATVRDVEASFNVEDIQQELDDLRKAKAKPRASTFVRILDRLFGGMPDTSSAYEEELTALLMLARRRRSKPRCLRCGSDSTVSIAFGDDGNIREFVHSCGHTLYKVPEDPDAPRLMYRPEIIELDQEGHRLG